MNFHGLIVTHAPFLSFRMQRGDFVALTDRLARRPLWVHGLFVLFGITVMAGSLFASVDGDLLRLVDLVTVIGKGEAPLWIYPLLAAGPLLTTLRRPWYRLAAGRIYRKSALADRELHYRFTSDAVEGGTPEIQSRYLWAAVRGVIETPEHAFLMLSRREAVILPRRATPQPEDFEALLAFARSRIVANRATKA